VTDFATKEHVAARLRRSLTTEEEAQVDGVLETVSGLIRSEVGKAASWDPSPVPSLFRELAIQKAIAALGNPLGVAQESETLGDYSHSTTFQRAQDGGPLISPEEGRQLRFALYGTNAASTRSRSHADTILDLHDDGEINDSLGS
jgi:hypothetical protein